MCLPALREQKQIANFLGALDDRIALLRETNSTLNAVTQALFKSWFVDFDPAQDKVKGIQPKVMGSFAAVMIPNCFGDTPMVYCRRDGNAINV
ncbi:MAG: restriction modification system specificity protein [Pseudomonas sp.]|nr:restriction modification system specificity protein [Pseudomonas sp.]